MLFARNAYLSLFGGNPYKFMLCNIRLVPAGTFMPVVRFIRCPRIAIGMAGRIDVRNCLRLCFCPILREGGRVGGFAFFGTVGNFCLLAGYGRLRYFHVSGIVLTDAGRRAGFSVPAPRIGGRGPRYG